MTGFGVGEDESAQIWYPTPSILGGFMKYFSVALGPDQAYFLIQSSQPLTGELQTRLYALLQASPADLGGLTGSWVVPRLGTTSPWSSKATDIAQRCGFDSILRIENQP